MKCTLTTTNNSKNNSNIWLAGILKSSIHNNSKNIYDVTHKTNDRDSSTIIPNYQTENDTDTDQINNDMTTSAWGCNPGMYSMLLSHFKHYFESFSFMSDDKEMSESEENKGHRKYVFSITHSPHTSILCP